MTDWNDPAVRARLIEHVGPAEYGRLQRLHFADSAVASVNGYLIRPVSTRFGCLYSVHGTREVFSTLTRAETHVASLPAGGDTV